MDDLPTPESPNSTILASIIVYVATMFSLEYVCPDCPAFPPVFSRGCDDPPILNDWPVTIVGSLFLPPPQQPPALSCYFDSMFLIF